MRNVDVFDHHRESANIATLPVSMGRVDTELREGPGSGWLSRRLKAQLDLFA